MLRRGLAPVPYAPSPFPVVAMDGMVASARCPVWLAAVLGARGTHRVVAAYESGYVTPSRRGLPRRLGTTKKVAGFTGRREVVVSCAR